MIDFGLAKRYLCPKTGDHIPYKPEKGVIGTTKFLSLSGHYGNEHSRRDDMEALGFILLYFLRKGKLPWDLPRPSELMIDAKDPNAYQNQILKDKAIENWEREVLQKKEAATLDDLCEDHPIQFKRYMQYVRGLDFD